MGYAKTRARTKVHNKQKVTYNMEFHLKNISFYMSYGDCISISLKDKTYEDEDAIKLLKVFYNILDMEVKDIELRKLSRL